MATGHISQKDISHRAEINRFGFCVSDQFLLFIYLHAYLTCIYLFIDITLIFYCISLCVSLSLHLSVSLSISVQLVGGQFDLEMNFIIQETESITCMVDLLDKCEVTCQAEVWSMFTAVLKKSVRNMQACTDVGLITLVLQRIDRADNMIAGKTLRREESCLRRRDVVSGLSHDLCVSLSVSQTCWWTCWVFWRVTASQ